LIDLHCHLDLYPDPTSVIQECRKKGIYVLAVTTTPKAWGGIIKLLNHSPRIKPALGLHPQVAHRYADTLPIFEILIKETRYVGEIGLDGTMNFQVNAGIQIRVLKEILKICSFAGGRILSIHSRGATTKVLDEVEAHPDSGKPILHWFSGNHRELKRAIQMGCWFSVGVAMLQSKKGKEITLRIPRSRILTETDGPFCKKDGKPLTPLDIPKAEGLLARIWNEPIASVKDQLSISFRNLVAD
jgi:TatD DNase family protein